MGLTDIFSDFYAAIGIAEIHAEAPPEEEEEEEEEEEVEDPKPKLEEGRDFHTMLCLLAQTGYYAFAIERERRSIPLSRPLKLSIPVPLGSIVFSP